MFINLHNKDGEVIMVTTTAYENVYSRQGWVPLNTDPEEGKIKIREDEPSEKKGKDKRKGE